MKKYWNKIVAVPLGKLSARSGMQKMAKWLIWAGVIGTLCTMLCGSWADFDLDSESYREAVINYYNTSKIVKVRGIRWKCIKRTDLLVIEAEDGDYCLHPMNVVFIKRK